jgi:hypothetical protein
MARRRTTTQQARAPGTTDARTRSKQQAHRITNTHRCLAHSHSSLLPHCAHALALVPHHARTRKQAPRAALLTLLLLRACGGAAAEGLSLRLSGAASAASAAFALSGAPSALSSGVNGLVLSGLEAPLTGALHVTLRARYGLTPNDTSLVPGFACRHFRHLFAFDGVAAVVRGDRLWVGCVRRFT